MATTKTMNGWSIDELSGTEKHYTNGVLHAATGPAERRTNGTELYYQNGQLHRDGDQPAMITAGGSLKYAKNGKYHRDNGPAIIWTKGGGPGQKYREEYWKDGEVERAVRTDSVQVWFAPNCTRISSAILSRKDGPALIYQDGVGEYYLNGSHFLTKKSWEEAVKLDNLRIANEKLINSKIDSEDEIETNTVLATKSVNSKGIKKMEKPSMSEMLKSNAIEAGYRVGATQATKVIRTAILNLMRKNGSDEGMISNLASFLETPFGEAMIGFMLGSGLQYLPGYGGDARVQKLAEEMRVGGMTLAGNAIIGEAMQSILPALTDVLKNLPSIEDESNVTRIKGSSLATEVEQEEEKTEVKSLKTGRV